MSSDSLKWEADALGAFATFLIDTAVYNKITIFKTAYWYTNHCYVFLSKPDDLTETVRIEIRPKKEIGGEELIVLCREFCNSLVDQQVRQYVIAETGSIRDSLIKKAFFEGKQTDDSPSEDRNIPKAGQSHMNDPLKIGRSTGT